MMSTWMLTVAWISCTKAAGTQTMTINHKIDEQKSAKALMPLSGGGGGDNGGGPQGDGRRVADGSDAFALRGKGVFRLRLRSCDDLRGLPRTKPTA